jgi:CDP-glucose 4,6-dehydratase
VTRVLVTGGRGLIGSWLVGALLERGDTVTVLSRGGRPRPNVGPQDGGSAAEFLAGDIRDPAAVDRALAGRNVELVFHLAGQAIVATAGHAPADTFATNVAGVWTLLDACRAAATVTRVVVASSAQVYGPAPRSPATEEARLDPADPYAASKAAGDLIARSYWPAHGLPVAVARLGNVYGGGDMNPSRLVPEAVWAALARRRPAIRSDGTARRDFLHVDDAVAAYLAIADLLRDPTLAAGLAFNAAGPTRPTVLDVVREVFAAADAPLDPDLQPGPPSGLGGAADPGNAPGPTVDDSRLRELTGWQPRVDLADGIRRTVAWYRRNAPAPPPDAGRSTT